MNKSEKYSISTDGMPIFTVAIVTFQQRHLLNECLQSVFEQNYPNIQLVICDDHSCDFDMREVREYVEKYKKSNITSVTIYQQERNVGTSANYETAYELSCGEFLKLQAGNDVLKNECVLANVVGKFSGTSANLLFSRAQAISYEGKSTSTVFPSSANFAAAEGMDSEELFEAIATKKWDMFVCASAVFWRTSFLKKMGGFDLSYKYAKDWPMLLRVCAVGEKPYYWDEITVLHHYCNIQNDQRIMNKQLSRNYYKECERILMDIAYPRLAEKHTPIAQARCKQAARNMHFREICELDWPQMSLCNKVAWKIKNIGYLFVSLFMQMQVHDYHKLKLKRMAAACVCICLLYRFQVSLYPGWDAQMLYSVCLLLLVAMIGCELFVRLIGKAMQAKYRES